MTMTEPAAQPDAGAAGTGRLGGWMPVAANATVAGITQVFWLTYSPIATDSAQHYGVSTSAITWLANVYPLLYVLLAIPVGRLLDRSPRSTLIAGALLTGLGGVVRIAADSYGAALAGQVIISIAQPVLLNGLIVVARANLRPEQRPAGIAAGSVGFFVGVLVGYTMPVLMVDGTDIQDLLVAQAVIGVVGAGWMAFAVRHTQAHDLADDVGTGALRRVLQDRGVRVLALLAFGGFGVFGTLLQVMQPALRPWHVSTDHADLLVDGMVLAGLVVAAVAPTWAAKTGRQRGLLLAALTVASIATALCAVNPPLAVLAVLLAIVGAMLVPALPILLEIAERRMPELSGTISAVIWLGGNFGVFVLAGVGSLLYDSPAVLFLMLAIAGGATVAYARAALTDTLATD